MHVLVYARNRRKEGQNTFGFYLRVCAIAELMEKLEKKNAGLLLICHLAASMTSFTCTESCAMNVGAPA